jgi:spore germination protein KC
MIIKTNRFIPVFICLTLTLFSGCWDYREIDDQIIVMGTAVDYDRKSQGISLTVEITLPTSSGKESNFSSKIYQSKGRNIIDAIVGMQTKAGRQLLWSHAKVIIFSTELLQQEKLLIGTMDWIKRNRKIRDTIWLLLSKEKTAAEILLKSNPQTQRIVSQYLDFLFLGRKAETFPSVPYWQFSNDLRSVSACTILPIVSLESSKNGILPFLNGTAVLDRTKVTCLLDGQQTRILLLLMNKLGQAVFTPELSANRKLQTVSLTTVKCQAEIKPVLQQQGLQMSIHVKIAAQISEIDGTGDVFQPTGLEKLIKATKSLIKVKINNLLKLLKENCRSDVFGFGNKVEANYPKLWSKLKNNWRNEYAKIPVAIHLQLQIVGSEQSMKVTKVGQ